MKRVYQSFLFLVFTCFFRFMISESFAEAPAVEKIQRAIARWDYVRAIPAALEVLENAEGDADRGRSHLLVARAYGVKGIEFYDAYAMSECLMQLGQAFHLNPSLMDEPGAARLLAYVSTYGSGKRSCNRKLKVANIQVQLNPENASRHFYLGMLHYYLAVNPEFIYSKQEQDYRIRLAAKSFEKSVDLDPERYEYWSYYISTLLRAGFEEKAEKALDHMNPGVFLGIEVDFSPENIPQSAINPYELTSLVLGPKKAEPYLRKRARENPDDASLQFFAAATYQDEDPDRCRELLEELSNAIASDEITLPIWRERLKIRVLYQLGGLYVRSKEWDKALGVYNQILELTPNYAQTRSHRGAVYRNLEKQATDTKKKQDFLDKAYKDSDPRLSMPWHDRVGFYKERLERTIASLELWEGFNIYLPRSRQMSFQAAREMPLEDLVLSVRPWLSSADIERYDGSTHLIYLRNSVSDPRYRDVSDFTPFVVTADGERCYLGLFWSGNYSMGPPDAAAKISYDPFAKLFGEWMGMESPGTLEIDWEKGTEKGSKDARFDPRIAKALKKKGQWSDGLDCTLNQVGIVGSGLETTVTYTYTLRNLDKDDLYVLDPDVMDREEFFNRFRIGMVGFYPLTEKNEMKRFYKRGYQDIKRSGFPNLFSYDLKMEWFTLLKSGQSMTRTIKDDNYPYIPGGKYEYRFDFAFPGYSRFMSGAVTREQWEREKGRIWIGEITKLGEVEVKRGK